MKTIRTTAVAILLLACSGETAQPNTIDKADAVGVKADSSLERRLCRAVGFPDDCDICYEAGWYDDGECDTFCQGPDSDCSDAAMQPSFVIQCAQDGVLDLRVEGSGHDQYEGKPVWVIAEQHYSLTAPDSVRVTALQSTIVGGAFKLECQDGLAANTPYPTLSVVIDSSDDMQCEATDIAWSTTSFGWNDDQFVSLDVTPQGLVVTYGSGSTTWTNMESFAPLSEVASMFGLPQACGG